MLRYYRHRSVVAKLVRSFKVLLGVGLTVAGVSSAWRALYVHSSERALLARRLVFMRSPIQGRLERANVVEGAILEAQAEAFEVVDPRVEIERRGALQERADALRGEVEVLERSVKALEELRTTHQRHDAASEKAQQAQLRLKLAEARAAEAARQALADSSELQLRRSVALEGAGLGTPSAREEAQGKQLNAAAGVEEARHEAEAIEALLRALASGAPVDTSAGAGFSYSRQKADELTLLCATRGQELEQRRAQLQATMRELEAEQRRVELMRKAAVGVPTRARVWKRLASAGEQIHQGQVLGSALDCSDAFVSALVSPRAAASVRIGSTTKVTLRGDDRSYEAVVIGIGATSGDLSPVRPSIEEAALTSGKLDAATSILLRITRGGEGLRRECAVGVDAEVAL